MKKLFEIIRTVDYDIFRLHTSNDYYWSVRRDSDGHWELAYPATEDFYVDDDRAMAKIGLGILNKLPPINIAELLEIVAKNGERK